MQRFNNRAQNGEGECTELSYWDSSCFFLVWENRYTRRRGRNNPIFIRLCCWKHSSRLLLSFSKGSAGKCVRVCIRVLYARVAITGRIYREMHVQHYAAAISLTMFLVHIPLKEMRYACNQEQNWIHFATDYFMIQEAAQLSNFSIQVNFLILFNRPNWCTNKSYKSLLSNQSYCFYIRFSLCCAFTIVMILQDAYRYPGCFRRVAIRVFIVCMSALCVAHYVPATLRSVHRHGSCLAGNYPENSPWPMYRYRFFPTHPLHYPWPAIGHFNPPTRNIRGMRRRKRSREIIHLRKSSATRVTQIFIVHPRLI